MWLVLLLIVLPGLIATVILLVISWREWRDFPQPVVEPADDFDRIEWRWPT